MRESVLRKVAAQAFFSNPKKDFYPAEPDEAGASRD
jgi:hypothetical protein